MWLVLCDDLDAPARWVYDELRARSVSAAFVPASALARAVRYVHRVGPDGASAEVVLADGRRISTTEVQGTLNRMLGLWPSAAFAASPDNDYAVQEVLSMYVSLLQSLRAPILNPPTAQGLSGRMRYTPDWLVLAARSGFATTRYTVSTREGFTPPIHQPVALGAAMSRHNVIVAAGRVFGDPLSAPASTAACRLARLAGLQLLGLQLVTHSDGKTWFEAADLYPDLRTGGAGLIDHLAGLVPAELVT